MVILMVACGNSGDEAIKKKITVNKTKIAKLEKTIADLEKQLSDTTESHRMVPVVVKELKPETFNHYIVAYGDVEAENYANISPEGMGGIIRAIHVDEGQYVTKGTLLVSLNTDALNKNIEALKSTVELATTAFEKQQNLWDKGIGSEIQYLKAKTDKESAVANLESLRAQKRMSEVFAPFDGYVDKILMKKGELAAPGFPLIEFVNLSKLTITADLSESHLGKINKGDIVEAIFSNFPDDTIKTPIVRVSKIINRDSRTFQIELKLNNSSGKIKPNMVSELRIKDFSTDKALVIPSLAIKKDMTGNYVYTVKPAKDGKNIVFKNYINLDLAYQDKTMIAKGLKAGDKVIVKGHTMVSAGVPVNVQ